jgi:hypothetical protein
LGLIHDQVAVLFHQQRRTYTTLVFYRKHVAFLSIAFILDLTLSLQLLLPLIASDAIFKT